MAVIQFYEKPGCIGNKRQKRMLEQAGHHLVVHDLLSEPWSKGRLRRFFGLLPVSEWFNRSAPALKRGDINPERLKSEQALAMMIKDPLLIRRPLMEANGRTWVGFDLQQMDGMLSGVPVGDFEACPTPNNPCTEQSREASE